MKSKARAKSSLTYPDLSTKSRAGDKNLSITKRPLVCYLLRLFSAPPTRPNDASVRQPTSDESTKASQRRINAMPLATCLRLVTSMVFSLGQERNEDHAGHYARHQRQDTEEHPRKCSRHSRPSGWFFAARSGQEQRRSMPCSSSVLLCMATRTASSFDDAL